jgi:hypothetical protein
MPALIELVHVSLTTTKIIKNVSLTTIIESSLRWNVLTDAQHSPTITSTLYFGRPLIRNFRYQNLLRTPITLRYSPAQCLQTHIWPDKDCCEMIICSENKILKKGKLLFRLRSFALGYLAVNTDVGTTNFLILDFRPIYRILIF